MSSEVSRHLMEEGQFLQLYDTNSFQSYRLARIRGAS
jgi:hypothetical protein